MIRINQIKVPLEHTQEDIIKQVARQLRVKPSKIKELQIVKKSIDARKKPNIAVCYTIDVAVASEQSVLAGCKNAQVQLAKTIEYCFPMCGQKQLPSRPVIVGTGPAGLFCGYMLAKHGYRPILIERGCRVQQRKGDVECFWRNGVLRKNSNVQFGEGGAGTFSDGKLNTLVKDKMGRNREVLRILVESGAPERILYEAKPHIGTDVLIRVVAGIREKIISWGGEFRFESQVTDLVLADSQIEGIVVNHSERLETQLVVLAIGHSARDTFEMLHCRGIPMEAKSFAVGLRIEHPRKMIDKLQYGRADDPRLPAASYKVTAQTKEGRGVYSFCMCPGGYVVNASSEEGRLAVNGMSYSGRDGQNSNSAMIVTVTPNDYGGSGPLAGVTFQRRLEERAYEIGGGKVPVEQYGEFRKALTGVIPESSDIAREYPDFAPAIKGSYTMAPVHEIMPDFLGKAFIEGIDLVSQNIPGFNDSGAFLSGIESRTSSPIRMGRDETGQSSVKGIFPCGEGAGYAGGITSAAMDGILIAEKIASIYKNNEREMEKKHVSNKRNDEG